MASVVGNDPQSGPINSLAQTIDADEAVIKQVRLLHLRDTKTVPETNEKYSGVCKVTKEVKEGPKKRRFEAVTGYSSA
jgi:hypothetical protein